MPEEMDDATLDMLLARAGITPIPEQRAGLKANVAVVAAMAANVRKPRGRMAELAHVYNFTAEDLV